MQRVFVDFTNADERGRVRLNTEGTINDLCSQGIELVEGLRLTLYQEEVHRRCPELPCNEVHSSAPTATQEVEMQGVVEYSLEEQVWVAKVDWWDYIEKNSTVIP